MQTLVRRLDKIHPPQLIISDEAHHSRAGQWVKIFEKFNKANILGVTATPVRLSGEGLGREAGGVFDSMVNGPTVSELIQRGYLATPRVFAPPVGADLAQLRRKYGEFVQGEVAEIMDKPVITGHAVDHYRKLCNGVPAIAFCASVAHAEHVAEQFRAAGFQSASIDGTMHDAERKQRVRDLGNGQIHVLTSCEVLSEGFNAPIVGAAILLRPTASLGLYMQQVGRALRVYPGKSEAIVLDHVGNTMRHGFVDADREWTLEGNKKSGRKKDEDDQDIKVKQCSQCYSCFIPAPKCPYCGHVETPTAREIEIAEGQLEEIDAKRLAEIEKDRAKMFATRERGQATTMQELRDVITKQGGNPNQAYFIMKARSQRQGART